MNKNNTVDSEEIAKFAKMANRWWDKTGDLKTLHDINPARLEFIKNYTPLAKMPVLDVGCGGGILSESMAFEGALVTGIDAEASLVKVAENHAKQENLTINYQCSPIETFESKPFAIITCMEMLEHVEEPEQVINHCARLLESGGYLFLSTINRTMKAYLSAIIAAEYIFGLLPKQTHDYKKFIKPGELAAMVRAAGFNVIGLQGMTYNPLNGAACLENSVAVNYLMACVKP